MLQNVETSLKSLINVQVSQTSDGKKLLQTLQNLVKVPNDLQRENPSAFNAVKNAYDCVLSHATPSSAK